MRDIKFRGKRVDNGEWVYGHYWRDNSNGKHKITVDLSDDNFRCYEVLPETVGEFTGLTDKNGKEIYEGDVLSKEPFLKVVFENGGFCFSNDLLSGSDRLSQDRVYRLEVIGNLHDTLHDTPTLLKTTDHDA